MLSEEKLGERKPSQFLRRLKECVGKYSDATITWDVFLSRFPETWQPLVVDVGDGRFLQKLA